MDNVDIDRAKKTIREYALNEWLHAKYGLFTNNCVDSTRYAVKKMGVLFGVSDSAFPREFVVDTIQRLFANEETRLGDESFLPTEELRLSDLRKMQYLKAFIEMLQTGPDELNSSKTNIYKKNKGSEWLQKHCWQDDCSVVDYSFNPEGKPEKELKKFLANCPELPLDMYKLHHDLITEYIPYCQNKKKYSSQDMLNNMLKINGVLADCAGVKATDFKIDKEFGQSLRTQIISFFFDLIRKIKSSKLERKIQKWDEMQATPGTRKLSTTSGG